MPTEQSQFHGYEIKGLPLPPELEGRVPVLADIAMPKDTNPLGDVFGGWLLAQMDLAAGHAAHVFARGKPVKTRAISEIEFHKPVYIGDKVALYADIVHVGNTSVRIKIESWVLRRNELKYEKVTEGTFTMVAIGPDGRPTPVLTKKFSGMA